LRLVRVGTSHVAGMAELVDARDLKSLGPRLSGFESRCPHHLQNNLIFYWQATTGQPDL
jgi:hypothetical protein